MPSACAWLLELRADRGDLTCRVLAQCLPSRVEVVADASDLVVHAGMKLTLLPGTSVFRLRDRGVVRGRTLIAGISNRLQLGPHRRRLLRGDRRCRLAIDERRRRLVTCDEVRRRLVARQHRSRIRGEAVDTHAELAGELPDARFQLVAEVADALLAALGDSVDPPAELVEPVGRIRDLGPCCQGFELAAKLSRNRGEIIAIRGPLREVCIQARLDPLLETVERLEGRLEPDEASACRERVADAKGVEPCQRFTQLGETAFDRCQPFDACRKPLHACLDRRIDVRSDRELVEARAQLRELVLSWRHSGDLLDPREESSGERFALGGRALLDPTHLVPKLRGRRRLRDTKLEVAHP